MKIQEWSTPYNPFNSMKNLVHAKSFNAILDRKVLPPIVVNYDLTNLCNYNCNFCMFANRDRADQSGKSFRSTNASIPKGHSLTLPKLWKEWGVKAVCFTGDTKVKLINGTNKTFKELVKNWDENKKPFEVYSRDENGNIVPAEAINPRETQKVKEIIELTLDNTEKIKCTKEHLIMIKNPNENDNRVIWFNGLPYIKAMELEINDSIMPLHTKILKHGYEYISDTTFSGPTHKLFGRFHYNKEISLNVNNVAMHHINSNKLDNTKKNIKVMSYEEHSKLHSKSELWKKNFSKNRNNWNETVEGKNHIKQLGKTTGVQNLINYNKSEKGRKKSGEIFKTFNSSEEGKKNSIKQFTKWNNSEEGKKQSLENFKKINEKRKLKKCNNHKIIQKELIILKKSISVYCLTVKKYGNFALSSGIFVKNCLGGGGDPTCHSDYLPMLEECKKQGLDIGMPSNGYLINNKKVWETICKTNKWIGFSIDAGTKEDYAITKGVSEKHFDKVIDNLHNIAKTKKNLESKLNIGYKFLIEDTNYKSIYQAIKIASEIGCNTIQIRPAISPNQVKLFKEHGDEIWEQVQKGREEFETKDFKVMGVQHKFKSNMEKKHDFEKCRASMLTTTWCADGKVYLCTDTRGNDWAELGEHYPDPKKFIKEWGNKKHWDIVDKINFEKCDRCTLAPQNEFFEKVFIDDRMEMNLI